MAAHSPMWVTAVALAAMTLGACAHRRSAAEGEPRAAASAPRTADVGFVVAAPDRGFLGNEEVADAAAELAAKHAATIVYVTDERTADDLRAAVADLAARGAKRVVVLPLFLSRAEHGHGQLERAVAAVRGSVPITLGEPLGASYLAVELLADRFRALHHTAGQHVVIAGYGAADEPGREALAQDLRRIAGAAAEGFGFASIEVVVWRDRDASPPGTPDAAAEYAMSGALREHPDAVVVPFALGPKLDSMMSFTAGLGRHVRGEATLAAADLTPDPLIGLWIAREANRHVPLADGEVGVVMLAHGSDHHWNQGMRDAVANVAARHPLEVAFSMADPPIVERAIRKLEARGARAIVVVRVFGLHASFRTDVERMLGLDIERPATPAAGTVSTLTTSPKLSKLTPSPHAHHGHGATAGPAPRIRSAALFATEGGLEDSPRFAAAMLDRARALSRDPARETIILVAHGTGDDATNDHWRSVLGTLADHMRQGDGAAFRAIHVGTWREDWPGKREPEVAAIRALVEQAARDGGRALVIPARTTAQGPERELLEGLTFELGTGFAPHPLFEAWFEEQITTAAARLRR